MGALTKYSSAITTFLMGFAISWLLVAFTVSDEKRTTLRLNSSLAAEKQKSASIQAKLEETVLEAEQKLQRVESDHEIEKLKFAKLKSTLQEERVQRRSCSPGQVTACTHRYLTFNLFASTNAGHVLLDDLLNILLYKPEKICNVRYPIIFGGMIDYEPLLSSSPCKENFLYYGYHQTQTLNFQVRDRVRIVKFTEPEMQKLYSHIRSRVSSQCKVDEKNPDEQVVMIRRRQVYGRSVNDTAVPEGVSSVYVDVKAQSLLEILCSINAFDLVIVPYGAEIVLPMILGKRFIGLTNDWKSDTFYFEALAQTMTPHNLLYFDSVPNARKPNHSYYNHFAPSSEQSQKLNSLIDSRNNSQHFVQFPFQPKGTASKDGLLWQIYKSRNEYLQKGETKNSA